MVSCTLFTCGVKALSNAAFRFEYRWSRRHPVDVSLFSWKESFNSVVFVHGHPELSGRCQLTTCALARNLGVSLHSQLPCRCSTKDDRWPFARSQPLISFLRLVLLWILDGPCIKISRAKADLDFFRIETTTGSRFPIWILRFWSALCSVRGAIHSSWWCVKRRILAVRGDCWIDFKGVR